LHLQEDHNGKQMLEQTQLRGDQEIKTSEPSQSAGHSSMENTWWKEATRRETAKASNTVGGREWLAFNQIIREFIGRSGRSKSGNE
jgi:hypothetical protein